MGGVTRDFDSNFRLGDGEAFVVEGDEYDTAYFDKGPKFLHYRPRTAIFTSCELDHADIYRDEAHYESAFARFVELLPADGYLAACSTWESVVAIARGARCPVETYSVERPADWEARGLALGADGARFRLCHAGRDLGPVRLTVGGAHNVENALGVAAAATRLGLTFAEIAAGLEAFRGVKRRQEVRGTEGGVTVIDDFAHHPTAVDRTLAAIQGSYPGARLLVAFEPRSNTCAATCTRRSTRGASGPRRRCGCSGRRRPTGCRRRSGSTWTGWRPGSRRAGCRPRRGGRSRRSSPTSPRGPGRGTWWWGCRTGRSGRSGRRSSRRCGRGDRGPARVTPHRSAGARGWASSLRALVLALRDPRGRGNRATHAPRGRDDRGFR